jgi:hypothetical protein
MKLTKHFKELNFTVVVTVDGLRAHFVVYEIDGYGEGANKGVYDVPFWHKAGSKSYPDPVDTIEESEPYLHGAVCSTGCSDWHFDEQDRIMLHACQREGLERFGKIMAACWDWAGELLPSWSG